MTSETAGPGVGDQFKAKVFISYSREDLAFVERFGAALKARGIEPLIDQTEIGAFDEWWTRIETVIARADTFVFVISPDSVASGVCARDRVRTVAHQAAGAGSKTARCRRRWPESTTSSSTTRRALKPIVE
jgi:hypothetical protein